MTHDEAIERLVGEAAASDRKRLTELFLQTLADGRIHSGLRVLSAMKTFHMHAYSRLNIAETGDEAEDERSETAEYRKPLREWRVVAFEDMPEERQAEIRNRTDPGHCVLCSCRFECDMEKYPYDSLYGFDENDIYGMLQCLRQENEESRSFPYDKKLACEGSRILTTVFETVLSAEESDGIRDVFRALKKTEFFRHWKKEEKRLGVRYYAELALQNLLEIMGYLGILHTDKHKGAFYEYCGGCPPQSSGRSDWGYPVDFWRGKNGVDKAAFRHWFGAYGELEKFWK